jgi:histidinol dehydrogenase
MPLPEVGCVRRLDSGTPEFTSAWRGICARGSEDDKDELRVREVAGRIVADVRARGDQALLEHTRQLDRWAPASAADLALGKDDFARAYRSLPRDGQEALTLAATRIEAFHAREQDAEVASFRDRTGATLAQVVRPLARVGLYVPGGLARYPSSVLMTAIPARVAGVRHVVVVSPGVNGTGEMDAWTQAACHVSKVSRLYRIGGAQAIAALAYGTETVGAVDKICGPGNAYVTAAKRMVYGRIDVDMQAGPSEILVVADAGADPVEVASDLIAQAEHGAGAVAVLLTPSASLAGRALAEVDRQLASLPRQEIARASLEGGSAVVVTRGLAEAVRLAEEYAPEHLALHVKEARRLVPRLSRAGAVFVGSATPEAVGDYVAGPSHVLPTGSAARFASPLSVASFRRRMSVLEFTPGALAKVAPAVEALARAEGLVGHWRAVEARVNRAARKAGPRAAAAPAGKRKAQPQRRRG